MANLSIHSTVVAYEDLSATSNPTQLPINWTSRLQNVPADNPSTNPFVVPGGTTFVVVDGSRPTSIDNSTAFDLQASPIDASRYRLTTSGGTPPNFRADRSLALSGTPLSLVVNRNLSVLATAASGSPFTSVRVGDVVMIPGPTTGDVPTLFSPLNEGIWTVLVGGDSSITIARFPGVTFSGVTETVTPATDAQFRAFSSDGVQIGDTIDITAGFAQPARRSSDVVAVAPEWVEFQSTSPIGSQVGIVPGVTGLLFYAGAKRWFRVEADQECTLRLNGDTGDGNRLVPIVAGDPKFRGYCEKLGPVWRAEVVNRTGVPMRLFVLAAE